MVSGDERAVRRTALPIRAFARFGAPSRRLIVFGKTIRINALSLKLGLARAIWPDPAGSGMRRA
jgi:hypothetical protein